MNSESQLFIPEKCKVGFNLREDTYSGRLGYVIGFDGKKWRKENSWEGWRQKEGQEISVGGKYVDGKYKAETKKIGPEVNPFEFVNSPTEGFVLNRKAGGERSHWNTRRTVCRAYDPRGFEVEIGIENLIYILENCNSLRGKGLEGKFVYSFSGKDLVLLPCNCPEYQKAEDYTSLQSEKIRAKDLVPGCSYKTKKQEDLVYVGRFDWWDWSENYYSDNPSVREAKKYHIFFDNESEGSDPYFTLKTNLDFLAVKNSDEPVLNYAEIIEKFQNNAHSSKIISWETVKVDVDFASKKEEYGGGRNQLKRSNYFRATGNNITQCSISIRNEYEAGKNNNYAYIQKGYVISNELNLNTNSGERQRVITPVSPNYWYRQQQEKTVVYQKEDLQKMSFCDLYANLENGKRIKVESLNYL